MVSPQNVERAKNILIVVLFLTTILLLYLLWENLTMQTFRLSDIMPDEDYETPAAREVTVPSDIVVSFGAGVYTVVEEEEREIWEAFMAALDSFGRASDVLLEEITRAQYEEVMGYRSVFCDFSYSLPFVELCQLYGLSNARNYSQVAFVDQLGYSAGSPESVFLHDGENEKYYRLVSDQSEQGFESIISQVEREGYVPYYQAGTYFGIVNTAVLPVTLTGTLAERDFVPEIDPTDRSQLQAFAEPFFGESFDFVRRIEESKGTVVYMYGYGQRVLTAYPDGGFEYREEESGETSGVQSYFEALETALEFVAAHGSWETEDGEFLEVCVQEAYELSAEGRRGYRFLFGMKLEGEPLYYENGAAIIVEVSHGQVVYYKRDLIFLEGEAEVPEEEGEDLSAANLVAQNYEYMAGVLREKGLIPEVEEGSGDTSFEAVAELIHSLEEGYLRPGSEGEEAGLLQPVWALSVGELDFYFDPAGGQPLGYTDKSEL
ncbi:MAG: two-component system activity regulator YycH [Bacillota bacterium]|nr:two-component system activity regulator YycH [Bacillota bacterium]